jgi:hypothetical protein
MGEHKDLYGSGRSEDSDSSPIQNHPAHGLMPAHDRGTRADCAARALRAWCGDAAVAFTGQRLA